MKFRVKNAEAWKAANPSITYMNDEILELTQEEVDEATTVSAIDPVEDIGEVLKEVEPKKNALACEECGKLCKTLAGLKAHQRTHEPKAQK